MESPVPDHRPVAANAASLRAEPERLVRSIRAWATELGFADVAFCDAASDARSREAEGRLQDWLDKGYHGTMAYMARHGLRRARPTELVPGTTTVVAVRMDYLPMREQEADGERADDGAERDPWVAGSWDALHDPLRANVSRYAHGRDYHRVVRSRLQRLADRIADAIGPFGHRVFTDSAPVMEVELAERAGLGWRGKHTLLLSREGGSMFFLGELFVDLALPADEPEADHCGRCTRCIDVCPTRAIVAPHVLDARRCISYLTIEHDGSIPVEFRAAIGNRIYGCDDCQLVCPWNKFARRSPLADFDVRSIADRRLVEVFAWDEATFLARTEGSAIRRIGHERWLRNVAVALGNALAVVEDADDRDAIARALAARIDDPSAVVREHVRWALTRATGAQATAPTAGA